MFQGMEQALTKPLGPLPVWGWAAIGGGVLFIFASRHGSPVAAKTLNPAVATPAPPGSTPTTPPGGGSGGGYVGGGNSGGNSGGGTTDPATGSQPGITAKDLFGGGSLGDFLKGLGPNYERFSLNSGSTSVGVDNSAQNILDEQGTEAGLAAALGSYKASNDYALGLAGLNLAAQTTQHKDDLTYALGAYTASNDYVLGRANYGLPSGYTPVPTGSAAYPNANNGTPYGYAPVTNPAVAVAPLAQSSASGPGSCAQGDLACVRRQCNRGNFSCAHSVAPWTSGMESSIWGR